jgi:hypothetical protein
MFAENSIEARISVPLVQSMPYYAHKLNLFSLLDPMREGISRLFEHV